MATSAPQEYGDLLLQFTTDFEQTYNDKGSGAGRDGSFWTPIPSEGFYILGSLGRGNYKDPNAEEWALCVRQTIRDSDALLHPVDWVLVWDDRGSGGNTDGSCWEPVPPAGYVALGHLFVKGYAKPPLAAMVCVREDLTVPALIGSQIWNDQKSGAKKDIGVWHIDTPPGESDHYCFIATNALFAVPDYNRPAFHSSANVLRLPFVSTSTQLPPLPQLTSQTGAGETTAEVIDHEVLIPFTAVSDSGRDLSWKISRSPFYKVQRSVQYELIILLINEKNETDSFSRSYETGVTKTQTEEFSVTTGITISYESGISVGAASSKVSASLSIELGYRQSTSVSVMQSMTTTAHVTVPRRHRAGLWSARFHIRVVRGDGSPLGKSLPFLPSSAMYITQQYPPPIDDATRVTSTASMG